MANKYQVLDQILTSDQGASGNYNIVFTTLDINDEDEGTEVVKTISEKIKEDINYSDLKNSPGIPQEGYEEINGELQPTKDFHKVAFTGDYTHLNNAPTIPLIDDQMPTEFDPIAFTGTVSLDNVQVSNVIDFRVAESSSPHITSDSGLEPEDITRYNNFLSKLGEKDNCILGFTPPLTNVITQFAIKFRDKQRPSYFRTKAGIFFVLDVEFNPADLSTNHFIKFNLAQINNISYNGDSSIDPTNVNNAGELIDGINILNNITFTKKNVSFIFDYINQAIFCKTSIVDEAAQIDTSNFTIHANQIPELKQVATTGDYNDLDNTFYTINFGDFIYRHDSVNDNWSILTGNEYNYLYSCGLITGSVRNINELYNSNNDETNIALINKAKSMYNNFNNNKLCYLISNNKKYLITDMVATYDNGDMASLLINCTFNSSTNYNSIMNDNTIDFNSDDDIQNILDKTFEIKYKTTVIFLDLSNNILYSIARQIYPISIVDSSLYIGNKNTNILGLKLSGKENNVLSIFNDDNLSESEKGLYLGYEELPESG